MKHIASSAILLSLVTVVLFAYASDDIPSGSNLATDQTVQGQDSDGIFSKHARAEYYQDQSMPNGIAFRIFLSNVTRMSAMSREDAVHSVVDSLNLSHDQEGYELAESLYDRFEIAHKELQAAIKTMEGRAICPPGRRSRSKEQVYAIFEQVEDQYEIISDNQLRKIRSQFTPAQYDLLLNHLSRSKLGIYYVKTDHAALYAEMPTLDVRDFVEQICRELGSSD